MTQRTSHAFRASVRSRFIFGPALRRILLACGVGVTAVAQEPPAAAPPGLTERPPTTESQSPVFQSQVLIPAPEELGLPVTTNAFEPPPSYMPWLPADAPEIPAWANPGPAASPFLRPGFGTSTLGPPTLPTAAPPERRGKGSLPIPVGPFDLRPSVSYQAVYGTGQLSGPGQQEATWQQSLTPGLSIYGGDHWTLVYSPTLRFYSTDEYDDTVDHLVSLSGWASYQDWKFRLSHATAITSDPLIETGQQTDQTTHSTGVGALWDRGPRGSWDFDLSQNIRFTDATGDLYSWALQTRYDYPIHPRLKVGAGVSAGYDYSDPGTDMASERLNFNISGPLGDKITYSASVGTELRHFVQGDASTRLSPIASAGLTYQVLERTLLNAGFSYDVGTSYFSDQYTRNTSVQGGITQILTERLTLNATGGYRVTSYESAGVEGTVSREDGSAFASVALSAKILSTVSGSLFYSFRGNSSNSDEFSFDSHQVGLSLSWSL